MKTLNAIIVVIQVAVLLSFTTSIHAGIPVQQPTSANDMEDIQTFFPLLEDETLEITYLLNELNIVGDQQKKLKAVGEQGLKEWLAIMAEGLKAGKDQRGGDPVKNEMLAFQKSFVDQIDEILLPNQMQAIRRLLKQRSLLQRFDFQGFELISSGTVSFDMSEPEERAFKAASKQLSVDFNERQRELALQAWAKIKPVMPGQSTQGLSEILELVQAEQKSRLRGERIEFRELKKWTADDYLNYETKKVQDLVYGLMRNQPLRDQLGVRDYQVELMLKINERRQNDVSANRHSDDQKKMTEMAAAGDIEGMKALFKEQQHAELVVRQQVIEAISDEVLLPEQIKLINSVAKFQRLSRETKYGDDFGAAVAWSRTFAGPDFESSKLTKLVNSTRATYYSELKNLRKSTWVKTLDALPPLAQQKFKSTYGEFYDFQAERIAGWDKFRGVSK